MRIIFVLIVILLFALSSIGQNSDAQLRTFLDISKKVHAKTEIKFSSEWRFNQNISKLNTQLFQLAAKQSLNKHFALELGYRFSQQLAQEGFWKCKHRLFLEFTTRKKINNLTFGLKNAWQTNYSQVFTSATGKIPKNYIRNEASIKYKLNRRSVFAVSWEEFLPIQNQQNLFFDESRFTANFDFKIYKNLIISYSYILSMEKNQINPQTKHIYQMGLSYKI